jgi:hypothetical protein
MAAQGELTSSSPLFHPSDRPAHTSVSLSLSISTTTTASLSDDLPPTYVEGFHNLEAVRRMKYRYVKTAETMDLYLSFTFSFRSLCQPSVLVSLCLSFCAESMFSVDWIRNGVR